MERVGRALLWALAALSSCAPPDAPTPASAGLSAPRLLAGEAPAGFARALAPRTLEFPRDHGAHPDFQTEWWYVTGHLRDGDGARYGFQVTFFRRALRPPQPEGPDASQASAWRSDSLWMAHAALLEVDEPRFQAVERFERDALGLAGVQAEPLRVWVADWQLEGQGAELFPARLRAGDAGFALDLRLAATKPLVLHGERGLSRKGSQPGNASYYYSATRLEVSGTLALAGEPRGVQGQAWLDREWSTSVLEPGQQGWDWFSLQLDDGRELMLFLLRAAPGSAAEHRAGTLVEGDGSARELSAQDIELEVLEHWTSPASGVRYPARWRLVLPREGLELELRPSAADAELRLAVRYWEGPLEVQGRGPAGPLAGRGYAELVGYGD